MKFYTSDWCVYEGLDQDTIIKLRAELGRKTQFITEEAYNAQQVLEKLNSRMEIF